MLKRREGCDLTMGKYVWFNNSRLVDIFTDDIEFDKTYVFKELDLDGNQYETKIKFEYDGQNDNIRLDRFDLSVLDAIYTLQKRGKETFTSQMVSNVIACKTTGYHKDASTRLAKINSSIEKLKVIKININSKMIYRVDKRHPDTFVSDNTIALIEKINSVSQVLNDDMISYKITGSMPMYDYAEFMGCVIEISDEFLKFNGVNESDSFLLVKHEIVKLIARAKMQDLDRYSMALSYNGDSSRIGLIKSSGLRECDYANDNQWRKRKSKFNQQVVAILDCLIANEYICSYSIIKDKNSNAGVNIKLRKRKTIKDDECYDNIAEHNHSEEYSYQENSRCQKDCVVLNDSAESIEVVNEKETVNCFDVNQINTLFLNASTAFHQMRIIDEFDKVFELQDNESVSCYTKTKITLKHDDVDLGNISREFANRLLPLTCFDLALLNVITTMSMMWNVEICECDSNWLEQLHKAIDIKQIAELFYQRELSHEEFELFFSKCCESIDKMSNIRIDIEWETHSLIDDEIVNDEHIISRLFFVQMLQYTNKKDLVNVKYQFAPSAALVSYAHDINAMCELPIQTIYPKDYNSDENDILTRYELATYIEHVKTNLKNNSKVILLYKDIEKYSNTIILHSELTSKTSAVDKINNILDQWIEDGYILGYKSLMSQDEPCGIEVKICKKRLVHYVHRLYNYVKGRNRESKFGVFVKRIEILLHYFAGNVDGRFLNAETQNC